MPFALNAVNGEITHTGTDTNIAGLMGIAGVTTTVYGSGSNTRTFYALINSLTITINGTLTWDTDFEAIIPEHSTALRTTRATFLISNGGILNYGLKADGTGSTSAGIYFAPIDDPLWFAGAIQPVITGSSFVVTGATSQFNAFGGQIIGSHTGSYLNNAQGNIRNLTVTLNSEGRPTGQDFLYRLYSPNITISNLNIRFGSVSIGTSFAGSIITTTRTDGEVGLWMQHLSGNAVIVLNSSFLNNTIDIAIYHEGGANISTTIVENSATGTALNIRGGEVGSNVTINNAGYLLVTRALAFNITDPSGVGVNDTTVLIVDTDNGNGKNLNNRDDTIRNTYRADIRNGALDNWTASGGASATIARSGSVVLGIINVVRNATNARGTSNSGIYRMDLKGLTGVQGEDTFRFLTFGYRYLPSVDDFSLAGRFVFRVTRALVVDNSVTQQDMAVVLAYEGIDINHQTRTITISRTLNLEQLVDFMKANKVLEVRMPSDTTILYTRTGTEIDITYNLVFETGTIFSGTSEYDTIRTTGTITGLDYINRDNLNAFDSTFDSSGRIIPFAGYTVITIYMTAADALARTNILFEGNILFYASSVFGGAEIFIRAEVAGDQDAPLIGRQAVPVGAGSYEFTTLRFSREDQFDTVNDTLARIEASIGNSGGGISRTDLVSGVHEALRTTEGVTPPELAQENSLRWINEQIRCQVFPFIVTGYYASDNEQSGILSTGTFTNTYTAVVIENATGSIVRVTRTGVGDGVENAQTGFRYDHHADPVDTGFNIVDDGSQSVPLAIDFRLTGSTERDNENQMVISEETLSISLQVGRAGRTHIITRMVKVDSLNRSIIFDSQPISFTNLSIFAVFVVFPQDSLITNLELSRFRVVRREMVLPDLFTQSLNLDNLNSSLNTALSVTNYDNATRGSIADEISKTRDSVNPFFASRVLNVRLATPVGINPEGSFSASIRFEDGEEVITVTKTDTNATDEFSIFLVTDEIELTSLDIFSISIRILNASSVDPHETMTVASHFSNGVRSPFPSRVAVSRSPAVVDFRIPTPETQTTSLTRLVFSSTGQNEWIQLEIRGFKLGDRIDLLQAVKESTRDVILEEEPEKYTDNSMFGKLSEIKRELFPFDNVASLNLVARQFVPVNPESNFTVSVLNDEVNIWRSGGTDEAVTVFFSGQPFRLTRNQTISMAVQILSSTQSDITTEDLRFILRTSEGSNETLTFTKEAFVGDTNIDVAFITGLSRETITVTQLEIIVLNDLANEWSHIRCVFGVFQTDRVSQLIRANATAISTLSESLQGVASLTPTSNV